MPVFLLPDLGEGLTEAEIVTWLVEEGQTVVVDQPVVEVETAKAMVEVPVPFAGTIARLHGAPGTTVAVGAPLVDVRSDVPAGLREPGTVTPEVAAADRSADVDPGAVEASGNVLIGYGTPAAGPRRRRGLRTARGGSPVTVAADPEPLAIPVTVSADPEPTTIPAAGRTAVAVISPLVRRLARTENLPLDSLTGSGPRGIIVRRDVEAALATLVAPTPAEPAQEAPGVRRIPLKGIRKVMADKLSRSRREIPEATVWVDVDATDLLAARRALHHPDQPVGLLALLARFTILGLARYPELNGRVEDDEIVLTDSVDLGFAAQTDRGLVVPVVRGAQRYTTRELSAALAERTAQARAGRLSPADLTGGSFTVNNYGVFGVDGSAAIINHPEVAILGMGRIIPRPWVVDGALAVRSLTQLTLAFDHRVCDGGTAGGFLRYVADCVESPIRALGDL